MPLHQRKHPRLKKFDYSSYGYYYVTINTHKNLPVLALQGYNSEYNDYDEMLSFIGKTAKLQLSELEIKTQSIIGICSCKIKVNAVKAVQPHFCKNRIKVCIPAFYIRI